MTPLFGNALCGLIIRPLLVLATIGYHMLAERREMKRQAEAKKQK